MQAQDPAQPDKTRQPLKNAMSTHEKPDKTRHPCENRLMTNFTYHSF